MLDFVVIEKTIYTAALSLGLDPRHEITIASVKLKNDGTIYISKAWGIFLYFLISTSYKCCFFKYHAFYPLLENT